MGEVYQEADEDPSDEGEHIPGKIERAESPLADEAERGDEGRRLALGGGVYSE